MDQPGLDRDRHFQALRGLERINFWSRSAAIVWPPLAEAARRSSRQLRVLDVATGAGDLPICLWHWARRAGIALHFDGCDLSPDAVAYARQRAATQGAGVSFFTCDALGPSLPGGYDIVLSSLFLHHLEEEQAVQLLRRLAEAAKRMVLVNDLVRSGAGLLLAYVGTRMLSRSLIVHTDGPRSVEGAFTPPEARALARRAGLVGATVEPRWPFRFLLRWDRP
jgi:2-polyprenyl-3-methyl-5-hydroxy-6-metoxy-1,4-benzoquinol methylase